MGRYLYKLRHLLLALGSIVQKIFLYRCTFTVQALNYCSSLFSNSSAIYTKWCAQTFPPIFWIFTIFDRNFVKIVAPPSDEKNENYIVHLKEQSLLKKAETSSKSGNKRQRNACSNYAALERTMLQTRSITKKHHIFGPTAGTHCAIFPKLCTVIELVVPIIKDVIHFLIQHIVFPTECTEKFDLIYRRAVSQQ